MVDNSSVKITSLGAIIQELNVGGQNIVLGFTKKELYEKYNTPWFGATIGRVANRIKGAKIQSLNDQEYELEKNSDPNALHGGSRGWGRRDFEGPKILHRNGKNTLLYTYTSSHLEGGYPGTVEVKVFYTTSEENNCSVLTIEYEVELVGDECNETVVNMTNHSYFNLNGGETVDGTSAKLFTQQYLPLDNTGIPFGSIEPHPSKVTEPFTIGPNKEAFDDVFVMDRDVARIPLDTRERPLQLLAAVDGNPSRGPFSGFCIEPSRFVNAINKSDWRHMVVLKKGDRYGSKIVYKTWKDPQ